MTDTAHKPNPIPNILTGFRLVAGMIMFLLLAGAIMSAYLDPQDQFNLYKAAFVCFVLAAITDFFDGWLARRWHAETRWGAILDPIADKILIAGAIAGLLASGTGVDIVIPLGLILFREFAVSALRETTAGRIELKVTLLAKWKTVLQMLAIGSQLLILAFGETFVEAPWIPAYYQFADILVWIAAIITVWTGWEYFAKAREGLRG